MWMGIVAVNLIFCAAMLTTIWKPLVALLGEIHQRASALNEHEHEQIDEGLQVVSWRQCSTCNAYERSVHVLCHRHVHPGILSKIELHREMRLYHVLMDFPNHYPIETHADLIQRDTIGAYYLWVQDVTHRQDWDKAIWLAYEAGLHTTDQLDAFTAFLVAYEAHMHCTITLHGALKSYLLQRDHHEKIVR